MTEDCSYWIYFPPEWTTPKPGRSGKLMAHPRIRKVLENPMIAAFRVQYDHNQLVIHVLKRMVPEKKDALAGQN